MTELTDEEKKSQLLIEGKRLLLLYEVQTVADLPLDVVKQYDNYVGQVMDPELYRHMLD
jgi:hypothetical protein